MKYSYDFAIVADAFLDESHQPFRGGAELHLSKVIDVMRRRNKKLLVIQQGLKDAQFRLDHAVDVVTLAKKGGRYTAAAHSLASASAPRVHYNQVLRLPAYLKDGHRVSVTFHGTDWDVPDLRSISTKYLTRFTRSAAAQHGYRLISAGKQYLALKKGARFLSVDSSLLRFAQQFIPEASPNVVAIPNFVDVDMFKPDGARGTLPPEAAERQIILFPRNFSIARGVPLLPEALRLLGDLGLNVHLLVCGQRVPKVVNPVAQAFQAELEAHGLQDRVTFLGSLDAEEMAAYYRVADLTIVPSMFSEGTSLSALEAMACGCPILVSNVGGLLDLATDGWNAWVCRADSASLAHVAAEALRNKEEAKRRAAVAQRQVICAFNYEEWARRVEIFFELQ